MICYLDSNIVMYLIENRPLWAPKTAAAIDRLQSSGDILAVSGLTRMECRVGPLRTDDGFLLQAFDTFFSAAGVQVVRVTSNVWDRAAWIRAKHRFRALDSIHLAAAVEAGCDVFLTNDNRLSGFSDIKVSDLP